MNGRMREFSGKSRHAVALVSALFFLWALQPATVLSQSLSGEIVRTGRGILEVRLAEGENKVASGSEVELSYAAGVMNMLLGRYRVISVDAGLVRLQELSSNNPAGQGMRVTITAAGKKPESGEPMALTGRVVRVTGKSIEIEMEAAVLPGNGDKVTLSFDVPGVGSVDLKGSWTVAGVTGGRVLAEPDGETGQPQMGHKARIMSTAPAGEGSRTRTDNSLFSDTYGTKVEVSDRDIEEMFARGKAYYYGSDGYDRDYAMAALQLRDAADLGHSGAQVLLGLMYSSGQGVVQDPAEARRWYQRAADQKNADGLFNLGVIYARGRGVELDYARALTLFRQAAELGEPNAQYNLGYLYRQGLGTKQDYIEAVKWFRRGAEQGHPPSQYALGTMYENGLGVEKNLELSQQWYRKAAASGYKKSNHGIGPR